MWLALMDALHVFVGRKMLPLTLLIADKLNLPKFVVHAPTFYLAFSSFAVSQPLSAYASRLLFPNVYPNLSKRTRYSWTTHIVSMIHALVVVPWAFYLVNAHVPALENNKAFGWDDRFGVLHAVTCGYFVWDTLEALLSGLGVDFVIHGAACLFIYSMGFRPWSTYYGPRALLWELSTPFLNIHWFLDKTGRTGSRFQLVNGVLLLSTFIGARLVYGPYISYDLFKTLYDVRHSAPPFLVGSFAVGNVLLNGLNWIWLMKMVNALRKRFDGKDKDNVTIDGQELQIPRKDPSKGNRRSSRTTDGTKKD